MSGVGIRDVDTVIARTTIAIISTSFQPADGGAKQCFRVKNLVRGEIDSLLSLWNASAKGTHLEKVRVVVAGDSDGNFPDEFRAGPGRSITYYRNHNESGLVYLETKVESDEQGLKNIFTLRDKNFLDGTFDTDLPPVPLRMFDISWDVACGHSSKAPALVRKRVLEALGHIHPKPAPVSARKYARFCLAVSVARQDRGGNLDPVEIDALVGEALLELDLFPDTCWRLSSGRAGRRLAQNAFHAEFASSASSELDLDLLLERCAQTTFKAEDGTEFPASEQRAWRAKCQEYCAIQTRELRAEVPYPIFEQLFRRDVAGMPLGERVASGITEHDSTRVIEYDALQVTQGLNRREAEEAQRFLETDPDDSDLPPLADVISGQTRRMVEKVAWPRAERFANPLSKIAEMAGLFRLRQKKSVASRIEVRPGRGFDETSPTLGLFVFLYGSTLRSVCRSTESPLDGFSLLVDPALLRLRDVPPLVEEKEVEDDDEPANLEPSWTAVPFEFHLVSQETGQELDAETNFEWLPSSHERLALLWLFLCADDAPSPEAIWAIPPESHLETWLTHACGRAIPLASCEAGTYPSEVHDSGVVSRLFTLMRELRVESAAGGISAMMLSDHFDRWREILADAKNEFVPDGAPDDRTAVFLATDCIDTDAGAGRLMLPSHPFRLRWFARYLDESENLALKGLGGDFPLNRQNDRLYLDAFAGRSPHQQPAISCARDRRFLLASGELGWTEQFVASGARQATAAVTDTSATGEIYTQVEAYLEAHPHRGDGLSVVVVLPRYSGLPTELVRRIRRQEWRHIELTVHVVSPRSLWDEIVADFESLPSDSRLSHGGKIFPPVQLRLHDFPGPEDSSWLGAGIRCDIAIAPHVLRDEVSLQQHTEPNLPSEGQFDVLLEEPSSGPRTCPLGLGGMMACD